jgi:hypothetical protein
VALSYPVLLYGILLVSTAHMHINGRSNDSIVSSRQSRALTSLQAALDLLQNRNKDTTQKSGYPLEADGVFSILSAREIALAAIMMQTTSVLMTGIGNVDMHMTCALHFITDLGYLHRPPPSIFSRTLTHRFAMVDVVLAHLRFRPPKAPLSFFMYQEYVDNEEPSFRDMHGCDQRVLHFLAQISVLSANVARAESSQFEIQAQAYILETEMRIWGHRYYDTMLCGASQSRFSASLGRSPHQLSERTDLDVVCECFYWTAHILLLRRVFLDPTESARVQLIRRHLFKLMDSLVAGCGADSSLSFPFYMAAREATTSAERDWVRRKHADLVDV